ncbi:MAG: hypothetical protein KDB21_13630, partial [Acidimicrobiales bacterium]|nr:hypothetical protein [Acidimicrobiales bacterium]
GRTIDPEHFGLSLAYGHDRAAVRALVTDYVSAGLTKFVLRPTDAVTNWRDELTWLADAVLDLQT